MINYKIDVQIRFYYVKSTTNCSLVRLKWNTVYVNQKQITSNENWAKLLKLDIWDVECSTYDALLMWLNGYIIFTVFDTSYKSSKQMYNFMHGEEVLEGLLMHIKLNV